MKKLALTVLWWWIRGLGQQYSRHMKLLWYHYRHKNKDWDRWEKITRYCILYSKLRSFWRRIRANPSVVGIRCTKNNTLSKTFSETVRIIRGVYYSTGIISSRACLVVPPAGKQSIIHTTWPRQVSRNTTDKPTQPLIKLNNTTSTIN